MLATQKHGRYHLVSDKGICEFKKHEQYILIVVPVVVHLVSDVSGTHTCSHRWPLLTSKRQPKCALHSDTQDEVGIGNRKELILIPGRLDTERYNHVREWIQNLGAV